jgi:hypothetical protein
MRGCTPHLRSLLFAELPPAKAIRRVRVHRQPEPIAIALIHSRHCSPRIEVPRGWRWGRCRALGLGLEPFHLALGLDLCV